MKDISRLRIHKGSSFCLPAGCSCGSGRDVEPSEREILRLIPIRLTRPSLEKVSLGCQDQFAGAVERIIKFNETNRRL